MSRPASTLLLALMILVVVVAAAPAIIRLVNAALIPLILVCGGVALMWQVVSYLIRRS
jgi:hypothetical protein